MTYFLFLFFFFSFLFFLLFLFFFFFNDTATTEIYTLSLHDALPILPATTPKGRLAIYQASVRRNCRVLNRHGCPSIIGSAEWSMEPYRLSSAVRNRLICFTMTGMPLRAALLRRSRMSQRSSASRCLRCCAARRSATATARSTGPIVIHSAESPRVPRCL